MASPAASRSPSTSWPGGPPTSPRGSSCSTSPRSRAVTPATREVLQRVAVVGMTFDTDEFVALSALPAAEAYDHLDAAVAAGLVEPEAVGYRFRHSLVRDALLEDVAPHRRRRIHRDAADRLAELGASPARIGHHLLDAGEPVRAVPELLRAAETSAAIGAYRDALELVDAIRAHATGADRARLLVLRGDLLIAIGDPTATAGYREALEASTGDVRRLVRARLRGQRRCRAIWTRPRQHSTASNPTAVPLTPRSSSRRAPSRTSRRPRHRLAGLRASTTPRPARRQARAGARTHGPPGTARPPARRMVRPHHRRAATHPRGPGGGHRDLRRVPLPAQYMLYGATPYGEVIELCSSLRVTAQRAARCAPWPSPRRSSARPRCWQATSSWPPASSTVDRAAPRDRLHGRGGAALQALAEVHLACGDAEEANRLLRQALPLARWSVIALHLLQRIFGTMILAAPDPASARAIVDRAEATLGTDDICPLCDITLAIPAAIACAKSDDLPNAHRYLETAERSAKLWEGSAWEAATAEAKAHVAVAAGDLEDARRLIATAVQGFTAAGQPLDAERCRSQAAAW